MGGVERVERAAKNEALFRDVNEQIERLGDIAFHGERFAAVCECSDPECFQPVEMSHGEYEAVRAHADRFVIAVGHELLEIEHIVERNERFAVVEKIGQAAAIVRELDPRG